MPAELQVAQEGNKAALQALRQLAPGQRMLDIRWLGAAKRQGARERRAKEAGGLLESGNKLGLE